MRDPKRIPRVLARIQELWEKYPDLRLTQLILNLTHQHPHLYNVEDNRLLQLLEKLYDSPVDSDEG